VHDLKVGDTQKGSGLVVAPNSVVKPLKNILNVEVTTEFGPTLKF